VLPLTLKRKVFDVAFQFDESLFYLVVWAIGFSSATVRVVRDHATNGIFDCLSIGMSGGFFAFGIVGIILRYDPPSDGNRFFYLAVAALVGLLGKEQDSYLRSLLKKVFKAVGIEDDKSNDK
jgi:hypothetical protein